MNSQLIPVFDGDISNESTLLCDARELHRHLEVGKHFASWIKERIAEYGFVENQDYILISQIRETKTGRGGDRRSKDYHLTLDTAKELAMVERNEKGRQVRRYFIECEKRAHKQVELPSPKKPKLTKPEHQQRNYFACLQIRDEVTGGVIELSLRADCMHSLATGLATCLGYRPIGFRSVPPRKDLMKKIA
ncbi:antA/AntB antirepressor family protein [Serratia nevei]|uniref:antA/AntB antirepressor family protein n=1 Tax=Serratia nevei TaxID=2703794 RepID=UPI003FA716F7